MEKEDKGDQMKSLRRSTDIQGRKNTESQCRIPQRSAPLCSVTMAP